MAFRQLAIEIFIMATIGALLGLLGPFGTYLMPAGLRLVYWIGFILVGYAIYRPIQTVSIWLANETGLAHWIALLIAAALAAFPLTVAIGFAINGMRYDPSILGEGFATLYLQVCGIGLVIQLLMTLIFGKASHNIDAEEGTKTPPPKPLSAREIAMPPPPDAPFFKRLPQDIGHNLVCLEMQDHYVKAHTLSGSAMILMRLRDAIAELDGIEGMQVHRSWWVARDAVRGVRRDGRNMKLELGNGLLAPVARNRQSDLKKAGWL